MSNKQIKNILISGSLVYDHIMDFPGYFKDCIMPDKIHILNVSFAVRDLKESFGGTAGNIAYNLALLGGCRPVVLSCLGKDSKKYKEWLIRKGVDISQVKTVKDKRTASAHIITDKADNQITGFNPGALAEKSKVVNAKKFNTENSLAIISPGNTRDMEDYAGFYKKEKIKYIYDPGQQIVTLKTQALSAAINGAEALIGNDYEIGLIQKRTGWTVRDIIDKVSILIITKGESGSEIYTKEEKIKIPAVKVKKAVDPTGAGDAYRAGLIKGMISDWPLARAGRLAGAVASFAVEKYGTQNHRFSLDELNRRHKRNF